jgi:hypothetical protein
MTIKLNSMDRLPEIDPLSPEYQRDPIATIDAIRAQSPLARSGRDLEVLTYAGCAEVYNNDNFESATPLLASRPADWECLRFDPVVETDVHVTAVATVIQGVEIPGGTVAWLNILGVVRPSDHYQLPSNPISA